MMTSSLYMAGTPMPRRASSQARYRNSSGVSCHTRMENDGWGRRTCAEASMAM